MEARILVSEEWGSLNVEVSLLHRCMSMYTFPTQTHRGDVGKEGCSHSLLRADFKLLKSSHSLIAECLITGGEKTFFTATCVCLGHYFYKDSMIERDIDLMWSQHSRRGDHYVLS